MRKKFYFSLLALCTILFQGIGAFSKENIDESSHLIRKKRLFDSTPGGNRPVNISQVPYIVNILKNGSSICGGSILSPHIILTAAHCVSEDKERYLIRSGSKYRNRGIPHTIRTKIPHENYNSTELPGDIALIVIETPIRLPNQIITLHNGPIHPSTEGTFSGWGCTRLGRNSITLPAELRSIQVPIISEEDCRRRYHNYYAITNKEICTLDTTDAHKGSCHGDSGGPLVVDGQLVGVMSWRRPGLPDGNTPDVFINLSNREYRHWVLLNILQIGV